MTAGCPLCRRGSERQLEHLDNQWLLCNACGRKFRRDDTRITWTDTNHTPRQPLPLVERDVSGNVVREK